MSSNATEPVRSRIEAVWEKMLPQTRERVEMLERTARGMVDGRSQQGEIDEAAGLAHKLAGSLGMFGLHEGTRVARELETELENAKPDAMRALALAQELRLSVFSGG